MRLYAGKMLIVDLTANTVSTEPLRQEWIREYWGAWGLALRYYCDAVEPEIDPLSPENVVVIMAGPLGGTLVPLASRLCLVSKSPHTRTIFESNIGGAFGPELKFAGYDGIVIKGRAEVPVFLKIADDRVTLESAESLTGRGIFETEKLMEAAIGTPEAKCLAIGPAAENLITFSMIGSESYRQFGRGGTGALFGSKNLKGIVCRGTGKIDVAEMGAFLERISYYKAHDLLTDDNLWAKTDGTPILVEVTNEMGIHPTKNYTRGFNGRKEKLNSDAIQAAKLGDRACFACPMACGKFTRVNSAEIEGPEYETLCLAGSNCEVNDLEAVIRFNRLCDDLGLDTMSCGSTISLAMEMTETGRHNFNLHFGQVDEYLKVIYEIATLSTERGRDLAQGAKKLAAKYSADDLSMEVKGLEMPAYEPRGNYGMGIAYATSERGACHLRAFPIFAQDPHDIDALVTEVVNAQNANGIKWSMGFCDFWGTVNTQIEAELMSAGLGEPVTAEELDRAGERIWNLSRLFNLQAGFTAADDTLPKKIMERPLEDGSQAGRVFSREDLTYAMQMYYRQRGWDEQGVPSQKKLHDLGLDQLCVKECRS
ncbi:MAG: aldehyde ferredoxin oxidoreductase family protein [Desulfuromonadaceae bacterium]|nr:aldehyde ferredoxin oxidoreductase family protein [Desulfuromonadaceae bacterium]MDD5105113.1 aldehyde ferredoxin oxidoreductase family protein [Desulfuromonadaceae bacterium]